MRVALNLPAMSLGVVTGVAATLASAPEARVAIWSALSANPQIPYIIMILVGIPALLYALMHYEGVATEREGKKSTDQPAGEGREEVEKQLGLFLTLISEQLKSSEKHASTVGLLSGRLDKVSSEPELRTIIQKLIASNEGYRQETAALERRLEKAHAKAALLKQRARHAESLASLDPLTGIANRRRFDDELEKQVASSHQDETPLALIMTDIDHFKSINDRFGHRTGDAMLRQFAELLRSMVRGTDLTARYGGEEFAIILPVAPLGNAFEIAERIRDAVQRRVWKDNLGNEIRLTASFGIADIRDGETAGDLINRADQILYDAKRRGRNRTLIWGTQVESV
jgi:diguanylate cyclase